MKPELYDGDIHIELRLDPRQDGLLSAGNARVGGTLILEIIPWDRSRVLVPEVGQRIEVVGPWVEEPKTVGAEYKPSVLEGWEPPAH